MKRRILTTILTATLAFVLTACGANNTSSASGDAASQIAKSTVTEEVGVPGEPDENGIIFPAGAPEVTNIEIHSARDYQMAAQLITAKKKGYFEQAGLNVNINWYQTASDIPTAMIAGDVDLAFGSWANPMQVKAYGVDCKILTTLGDASGTLGMFVQPDSGITSIEQIKDASITLTNAAVVTRTLSNICELYGMDYSSLNIVNTAPSDGVASFMNKQVDAIFTWMPYGAQVAEFGGVELINGAYDYSNGGKKPISGVYIAGYTFYVTEKYLAANPNTCARILWALAKAEVDLENCSPAEIAELTYEDMSLTAASIAEANIAAMSYSMDFTEESGQTFLDEIPYYVSIGSIPAEVDGTSILDSSVLEKVAPSWVKKSY